MSASPSQSTGSGPTAGKGPTAPAEAVDGQGAGAGGPAAGAGGPAVGAGGPAVGASMPREGGDPGLELTAYAEGPAGEAWALAMKLFFSSGKPRFVAVGQELDLSPPQGHALRLLVTARPMGELARLMHCDNSNITGIIDRLEERGLVERRSDQQDRRVRRIGLTPDGERIRERLFRAMAQPPEALERLPLADQKTLRDILRRAVGE